MLTTSRCSPSNRQSPSDIRSMVAANRSVCAVSTWSCLRRSSIFLLYCSSKVAVFLRAVTSMASTPECFVLLKDIVANLSQSRYLGGVLNSCREKQNTPRPSISPSSRYLPVDLRRQMVAEFVIGRLNVKSGKISINTLFTAVGEWAGRRRRTFFVRLFGCSNRN